MLWHNFAALFGMLAAVSHSYTPLFLYIWTGKISHRDTIDNTLHEKVIYSRKMADYQQKILMGKMLTN